MKAGFGKGTIRFPQEFFPQEGFCGVHDDPHVRLMVLEAEEGALALLEAELVIIPDSAIDRWRKQLAAAFRIPYEQTVVQMTHAITTPHEPGPLGPPDRRPEPTEEDLRKRKIYREATDRAVKDAIEDALWDLGEARWGWGKGTCPVAVNCDVETSFGWWLGADPQGYSDHDMTILRVEDHEGRPKGLLVSYGMKPAAIDNAGRAAGKRLVSSEIAGAFCEKMEHALGVPVLYSVSAGGNQIPRQVALSQQVTPGGILREVDLGPEKGFALADRQAEEMVMCAMTVLRTIRSEEEVRKVDWESIRIPWTRRRGGPRKLTKDPVHTPEGETEITADLVTFGGTALVLVRPELTAECGAYLRSRSPYERTLLMTLTNGEMKCLADRESFRRGTYEAQGSNLMPGAAEALMDQILTKMEVTI